MQPNPTNEQLRKRVRELEHESRLRKKAEDTLSRYEMIISTVNDPMSFVDRDYIYRTVNDAYARVFERSREEIIGRSVADLLGRDVFEEKVRKHIDDCLGGEEVHYEEWFDYPSWGRRYVIMSYYPFYENGGTITGIAVTASDITEHKLTEDALRKYELIISTVNDPMSFVDKNYIYQAVNDAYVNIFQKSRKEIIGHSVQDLLGRDVFEHKIKKHIDDCLTGKEIHYGEWFDYPTWGKRYVIMNYYPFYEDDQTITGIAVSASDITAHKHTEETLRKTTNELLIRNEIDRIFLTVEDDAVNSEILRIVLGALEINYGIFGHVNHRGESVYNSVIWDEIQGCCSLDSDVIFVRELLDDIWARALTERASFVSTTPIDVPRGYVPITNTLIVPIIYQKGLIGVFIVANSSLGTGDKEQQLLETIANHVAPILNARMQRNQEEEERKKAQEKLRKTNDELEEMVAIRTAELVATNEQLVREIEERKNAENALKESEESLRKLSAKLFDAKEEERKHLSRELHDGIGQYLTSIKFITENTINRVEKGPCAAEMEPLRTSIPIIQTIIDEVRQMSMNLRPSTLDDFGICVTIDWLCKEYQKIYENIHVIMEIDITEDEIRDELKIVMFRILQEALNNVATHSQATLVNVCVSGNVKGIDLIIRDNGIGFDIRSKKITRRANRGLGLVSMKERTELFGGTFRIKSATGFGTTIHAKWPKKVL